MAEGFQKFSAAYNFYCLSTLTEKGLSSSPVLLFTSGSLPILKLRIPPLMIGL
jgi:hypothetical protein